MALVYLASVPGKGSAGAILLQVAIVAVGVVVFGLLLARLVEQMNAGEGRALAGDRPRGGTWLESLPEEERAAFRAVRGLQMIGRPSIPGPSRVDSPGGSG